MIAGYGGSELTAYVLGFGIVTGAGVGLVFISTAADLGRRSLGGWAFMAVVVLALGNTAGRIFAGLLSDRIGRQLTLCFQFIGQALAIYLLFRLSRRPGAAWTAVLPIVFQDGLPPSMIMPQPFLPSTFRVTACGALT